MNQLPDMQHEATRVALEGLDDLTGAIELTDMDYMLARAVPGAVWDRSRHAMVLPAPTARAAVVALSLKPSLANEHPELVELRDTLIQNVSPTDYATRLQLHINAPIVHQSLLDEGNDWLEFDHEANEPVMFQRQLSTHEYPYPFTSTPLQPFPPSRWYEEVWPNQDTDLGYVAAILQKHGAAGLGWSRGYGKTLGLAAITEANGYKSVLVAVPNSAKLDTWVRELQKRLYTHRVLVYPDSSVSNYKRKQAATLKLAQDLHANDVPFFLLIHHEAVAGIAGKKARASGKGYTIQNGWARLKINWDLFGFDESHKLKDAGRNGSQVHRAAMKVPSKHRLALTGSIFENSWEELYGTNHWLYPQRYHLQWDDWNLRFFDYVEAIGKICVGILPGREQPLRDELGVFWVIREKTSKATMKRIGVELSAGQQKAYNELANAMLTQLEDGTYVSSEAGVVELTRLRQVASGLDLLSQTIADSTKLDETVKLIRRNPQDDFFVAVWYKASAYGIQSRLSSLNVLAFVVTGDVPIKRRAAIIAEAREAQGAGRQVVLIGTIATVGESLNLQFLNHVVRVDRSFNPALNRQVIDRVDRTGQKREVTATDIVAENTVDELVVMPNLSNKDAMRAMVLGRYA